MLNVMPQNSNRSRQIVAMIALSAMMFLQNMDVSAVNLALATIAREFNSKLSTIEWVLNIYAMAAGALMILSGRLGDIIGRRSIFIVGTIVFGVASLISGLAPNTFCIILGRFFQGVGMAFVFPQLIALSALTYFGSHKTNAVGFMVGIAGLSQAIGPTVGGYIIQWLSWRYIFLINVPVCIIAVFLALTSISESRDETHSGGIDYVGATLIFLSFFLITLALNEVQYWGVTSVEFITCLLFGIGMLICLIIIERRLSNPLIDVKLFLQKTFLFVALIRNFSIYGMVTVMLLMGLFMQNVLLYSPSKTGEVFLGMTCLFGTISLFMGWVTSRLGVIRPLLFGNLCGVLGLWWLSYVSEQASFMQIIVGLCLVGINLGVVMPTTVTAALSVIPQNKIGVASGVFYTLVFLSFSIAVAVSGALLHGLGAYFFHQLLAQSAIQINTVKDTMFSGIYSGAQAILQDSTSTTLMQTAQHAFVTATHWVFKFTAILLLLGFLLCFKLKNPQKISS